CCFAWQSEAPCECDAASRIRKTLQSVSFFQSSRASGAITRAALRNILPSTRGRAMGSVLHFFFALSMFAGSPALVATPSAGADPEISPSPARQLGERGQQAMRLGQSDQAIAFYEQSLSLDPQLIRAHLSLAAARLEIGDDDGACPHLGRYVEARPDETIVRGH